MFEWALNHRSMIADTSRMGAYRKAILEVVRPGDIVADIGTGIGVLSFFALQAGAARVYAIEEQQVMEDARLLARQNGLEDRIVFVKGRSDRVELPEKMDVIVCELIGFYGLEEDLPRFQLDARRRFLKRGGRLVPSRLELWLVPVEADGLWGELVEAWDGFPYGLDLSAVRAQAISRRYITKCRDKVCPLSGPGAMADMDFRVMEETPRVFRREFVIERDGSLHGLMGYLCSELSPSTRLSTACDQPTTHWKQSFFPLKERVAVAQGDQVGCILKAIPMGDAIFWEWGTEVIRGGVVVASFVQSDFAMGRKDLHLRRPEAIPLLSVEGEMQRKILNLCDGTRSLEEVAEVIRAQYPDKFKETKNAIEEVAGFLRPLVKAREEEALMGVLQPDAGERES